MKKHRECRRSSKTFSSTSAVTGNVTEKRRRFKKDGKRFEYEKN